MTPKSWRARLAEAGVADPAGDMRRLFDWAYRQGGEAEPQTRDSPNDMTLELYEIALSERLKRKPVAKIVGERAFWRHEFQVTPSVLDPRPDTETLVEIALQEPFSRVLDLGTGSGAIVLSLLADRPAALGVATDVSDDALNVAEWNAKQLGLAERVEFVRSDWFEKVEGGFDLIVSNPPYVSAEVYETLAPEILDWEPKIALTPGGDGLDAYRAICAGARTHLAPGGRLMVEIGYDQGQAVSELFSHAGLEDVTLHPDLNGKDRVVSGRCP